MDDTNVVYMDTSNYRPVKLSKTTLTELMIPSYANFGGKIHGGILLSLMDKIAYVCAAKHDGNYCVTASIDTVDFLQPIEVGELVSLLASVNYVGHSSMVVGIRVISENVKTHEVKHTNTSYFTMVAMDDEHRTLQVPGLLLTTHQEVRRFMEAIERKKLKQHYRQELEHIKESTIIERASQLLENERCLWISE
ncbi:MAG: acyl-CoA thioesterase [Sphingobacteriaceae bacterium]